MIVSVPTEAVVFMEMTLTLDEPPTPVPLPALPAMPAANDVMPTLPMIGRLSRIGRRLDWAMTVTLPPAVTTELLSTVAVASSPFTMRTDTASPTPVPLLSDSAAPPEMF